MSKYLYNGVELPEIPEWDKETHPYAVLCATGNEHAPYAVYYCKMLPQVTSGESVRVATLTNTARYLKYNAYMGWKYVVETTMGAKTLTGVFWTNTDILYSSSYSDNTALAGTLYLSASEPVLVEGSSDSEDSGDIVETDFMLYNGVKLPKLPEWDKETYKYALICGPYTVDDYPDAHYYSFAAVKLPLEFRAGNGYAFVSDTSLKYQSSRLATTQELAGYLNADGSALGSAGVNAWGELTDWTMLGLTAYPPILWTNYYILNSDDTVYLAPSDPVPIYVYRSKNTITLGSGKIYAVEYDGDALPSVEAVCVEANRLGYIKSGASLKYTEETAEEKDDLGYVAKIITTKTAVVLKCGLITWNLNTLRHLLDRYKVSVEGSRRTLKIGGAGNAQGKKYVIVFHHEDKIDGDMWAVIVGRNTAGFTITYGLGAGALIEPEFTALPQPDGTLVQLIEAGPTN